MSVLKTIGIAAALTGVFVSAARPSDELVQEVTSCVGRLSAQVEHAWLFPDRRSEGIELQRQDLIEILDTLVTPGMERTTLAARIDAKMAHSALLTQATFGTDPEQADWAKSRAARQIRHCNALLPDQPKDIPALSVAGRVQHAESRNREAWRASK